MVATGPRLPKPIGGDAGGDEPLRISLGEGMMGALTCCHLWELQEAGEGQQQQSAAQPGAG